MILDLDKLTKIATDEYQSAYSYSIVGDKKNDIYFAFGKKNNEFLVWRDVQKENSKESELKDFKQFQGNAIGFSEATDYFETLIAEQTTPSGSPENENNAPPIGFLEVLDKKSTVMVTMQDGRKASFSKGEYSLKSNILTILRELSGFEKGERYYVDKIGKNPRVLALYPIGDLEGDGGINEPINQEDIDQISNGEDPFNQEGDFPTPTDDGGDFPTPTDDGGDFPTPTDDGGDGGQPTDDGGDGGQPTDDGGDGGQPTDDGGDGGQPTDDDGEPDDYQPEPKTAKEIIAKTYAMKDYDTLVDFWGGEQGLMDDLLAMTDIEKSGIMSKLALNYESPSQFENTMRRIILT
jgi:hypothetical protein